MTGELKEWSKSVPIGETHYFDFDLFSNCADTNLQLLVKLIEEVDKVYHTIKNLNTIEMEDERE
ncbi:hypothetical protein EFY79_18470 [Hanamia caeni]|uniref:Uncharacterized protein n=2 Tax=Hanamia caeni TaxID=2294116 RepID=A0A3M9N796_9BACT|nr:hypothetical protein EFY79_18470 [Hanamia caeni]